VVGEFAFTLFLGVRDGEVSYEELGLVLVLVVGAGGFEGGVGVFWETVVARVGSHECLVWRWCWGRKECGKAVEV